MLLNCAILVFFLACHGRMPGLAAGACTPATCLNGGTCDTSYTGSGFKCNCPVEGRADYGPRCELGIRGYVSTFRFADSSKSKYVMTLHDLSKHPFYSDKLTVTFEFVAHCHNPPCQLFVIKDAASSPRVTVGLKPFETGFGAGDIEYLYIWMPTPGTDHSNANDATKILINRAASDSWSPHWLSLSIIMWKSSPGEITGSFTLCSLKTNDCVGTATRMAAFSDDLQLLFKNSKASIGRFVGCIRFPRVNGVLIDLGNVAGYEGLSNSRLSTTSSSDLTYPFCPFFVFSCHKFARDTKKFEQNYCGKDSQCNGEVKRWFSGNQETCTCRCINGKRRQLETVSKSDKCTNSPLTTNECTMDTPILSLGNANFSVEWKMKSGAGIRTGTRRMSLEAMFRTREVNCEKAFELVNAAEPLLNIQISHGLLFACINNTCLAFPKLSVSDGEWHSFSLNIRSYELTAILDMVSQVHLLKKVYTFSDAKLVLSLPHSCIRAIRLSNIYMPTGDTDATADDATNSIFITKGSGVGVGFTCVSCNCSNYSKEHCGLSANVPKCSCKGDFVRNSLGSCVAPKPCSCGADEVCDLSTGSCACKPGFGRDFHNNCVSTTCSCKIHEDCDTSTGVPLCTCRSGFARGLTGNCEILVNCSCRSNEVCDTASRLPLCRCQKDFVKDSAGNCVSTANNAQGLNCSLTPSGERRCGCKRGYALDSHGKCISLVGCSQCALFEDCDQSTGLPVCRCMDGFVRDNAGSCVVSEKLISAHMPNCCWVIRPGVPALILALALSMTVLQASI